MRGAGGESAAPLLQARQSGDGRSVDAVRPAAREILVAHRGGKREVYRSVEPDGRHTGERAHAKQAATTSGRRLAAVTGMLMGAAAVMMAVGGAVGVHVHLAAVIVRVGNAVLIGQAVEGGRAIREGERDRGSENAECVERRERQRGVDATSFCQSGQHRSGRSAACDGNKIE